MKRAIAVTLVFGMLFLAGCRESVREQPEDDPIVVGISQTGAESDWRVANSESMRAAFTEENGYRLLFENARQIHENQVIAVRRFIQQRVDYIILLPLVESGWESVLREAKDAGIPVIMVDRAVDVEDQTLYTARVGSDFAKQGQRAVSWMETAYDSRQDPIEIIHIRGTLDSSAQIGRSTALEHAVEQHENWTLLAQLDGGFTQAKAYETMYEYLLTLPDDQDVDVVYCENDNEAFGAIQALEECGFVCGEDVDVISFDATRRCLELCMEGKVSLAVECNPLLGPLAEEIIQMLEAGETPEKQHFIEEQIFTPDMLTDELIASRQY